jgi:hypothetical protein
VFTPELAMKAGNVWVRYTGIVAFPRKVRGKAPLTEHGFKDATVGATSVRSGGASGSMRT